MIKQISRVIDGLAHCVQVDSGKIASYTVDGFEFIHQRATGWPNSDTEMFPIIGPTAKADYRVQVNDSKVVLDQHGLLREFSYKHLTSEGKMSRWVKKYKAFTELTNSKYPENSPETVQFWPYDFTFIKSFGFNEKGLEITFEIEADKEMPFMLGYHPAFKINPDYKAELIADKQTHTIQNVLHAGSEAYEIAHSTRLILKNEKSIAIETEGFNHFMCWTEVPEMLCIEPITFYPSSVNQKELHKGFQTMNTPKRIFKTLMYPVELL